MYFPYAEKLPASSLMAALAEQDAPFFQDVFRLTTQQSAIEPKCNAQNFARRQRF